MFSRLFKRPAPDPAFDDERLDIAELLYPSGEVKCRYSRRLSQDGREWVRHGRFVSYHENGVIASEGNYEAGLEEGLWQDFHENGKRAAEGHYLQGKEDGVWRFWNEDGVEERTVRYTAGEELV